MIYTVFFGSNCIDEEFKFIIRDGHFMSVIKLIQVMYWLDVVYSSAGLEW